VTESRTVWKDLGSRRIESVIRQVCGQTLARVRVSQTKIVSIIISLQQMESM